MIQQKAAELMMSVPPAKRSLKDLQRAIEQAAHAQKYGFPNVSIGVSTDSFNVSQTVRFPRCRQVADGALQPRHRRPAPEVRREHVLLLLVSKTHFFLKWTYYHEILTLFSLYSLIGQDLALLEGQRKSYFGFPFQKKKWRKQ